MLCKLCKENITQENYECHLNIHKLEYECELLKSEKEKRELEIKVLKDRDGFFYCDKCDRRFDMHHINDHLKFHKLPKKWWQYLKIW